MLNDFERKIIKSEVFLHVYNLLKKCIEETDSEIEWYAKELNAEKSEDENDWDYRCIEEEKEKKKTYLELISYLKEQL